MSQGLLPAPAPGGDAGRRPGSRHPESRPADPRRAEPRRPETRRAGSLPPGFTPPVLHVPLRRIGGHTIDFSRRILVMAIVNRTPDSFFDEGRTFALDRAVDAGLRAVEDGADWIDVGGVPFKPGPELPVAEEIARVVPVVRALRARSDAVVSVDTFQPAVAAAAIVAGAAVINDTTGLHHPELADVVADSDATLIVTHSRAAPRQEFPRPRYDDVTREVARFLERRLDVARGRGIPEDRLIIDPGHDLNKTTVHSLELTRHLSEVTALGYPTLVAVSNKDFVGETLARAKPERRDGSIAAATLCAMLGARIVRMHDVRAAVDAMRMVEAVLGWRDPLEARHNLE